MFLNRIYAFLRKGAVGIPTLSAGLSALLFLVPDLESPLGTIINQFSSSRVKYVQLALEQYGISLFSQPIQWSTHFIDPITGLQTDGYRQNHELIQAAYNYVDPAFLQVLLGLGALSFVIVLCLLSRACLEVSRQDNPFLVICIYIMGVHALFDIQLFHLEFNTLLILTMMPWGSVNTSFTARGVNSPEYLD